MARIAFLMAWVGLGVAGVSAVAAAAIYLPLPHSRAAVAPEARLSRALPMPASDFDVARMWREGQAQLAALSLLPQDKAWIPDGGLSTLLTTRFPNAGRVRLPEQAIAAPLPLPRPDGIERQETPRVAVTRIAPDSAGPQIAALPPQTPSEPGIFDRLFGDPDRSAKAIIAANPNTVLYDITRKVVYMPDGEKLEAHSGFGQYLDDPDSMHRKDVGVTPANVYAVSFREKPFRGVRALRMKPVGGGNMHGRDGFLAHSFLLGDNGQSNGCISVRDYDKFLQAFEDGKFDRIIVLRSADEPLPAMVAGGPRGEGT
ncbi:MAG: DUF2778 domain-containing protein [Pseudolabrys sp.]|nr:DUF2778 domain-containing protein [Pseudolabrys sp.]